MEPLTGDPRDVLPTLVRIINTVASNRDIKEFYIGRGVDLSERKLYHDSDDIIPVYSTESVSDAIDVEAKLIRSFYIHHKWSKDAPHGRGRTSEGNVNYVYVAIWINRGTVKS